MVFAATRLRIAVLYFVALLLLLPLVVVAAQGQTQITTCGTFITAPGNYVLANDLTCSNFGIIISRASDVVVNLAGHRITGSSTPDGSAGIKVQSGASRIRIQGPGVITSFTGRNSGGVLFFSTGTQEITAVTCTGNTNGFLLAGPARVHGNLATNNGDGIVLLGSGQMEITDNLATGNTMDGIVTATSRNMHRIMHNTAAFNGRYGISAEDGSRDNNIISNTALGNGSYDLFDGNSTCQNKWEANTFGTSEGPCIH
jgi:parallel beta-helix repeat protein